MRHGRDPSLRELKNFFKIFCQPFPIFRKFVNGYDRTIFYDYVSHHQSSWFCCFQQQLQATVVKNVRPSSSSYHSRTLSGFYLQRNWNAM